MTTDKRTECGLCLVRTRHISSHVLAAHVPYYSPDTAIAAAALAAERAARIAKVR